jgi:hypothetical protein
MWEVIVNSRALGDRDVRAILLARSIGIQMIGNIAVLCEVFKLE